MRSKKNRHGQIPRLISKIGKNRYSKFSEHQRKCYRMIEQAYIEDKVFVHFDQIIYSDDDNDMNKNVIRMSIVTEEMLSYDSEVLNNEKINPEYRPYFMSFIAEVDRKDSINERIGSWTLASFSNKDMGYELSGIVEVSASPISYETGVLYVKDSNLSKKAVSRINKSYPCPKKTNDLSVGKKFERFFSSVDLTKSYIYKVGNANLIEIVGKKSGKKFSFLYDVGYHLCAGKISERKQYNRAILTLKYKKPNGVIISHWDADHYLSVVYASNDIFKCAWFAPCLVGDEGVNVKRLVAYVNRVSSIVLVDRNGGENTLASINNGVSTINIFRGSGGGNTTKINSQGLAISAENKTCCGDIKTMFQADVPYKALENTAWAVGNDYDYLVVPHHGAKTNTYLLHSVVDGIAIVCGNNSRIRPTPEHRNELVSNGYTVYVTEDCNTCYKIDMTQKGKITPK